MSEIPRPLTIRDAIRLRPGMYVGGTDQRAMHHLVYELLDNSAEEAFLGGCSQIELVLRPDNEIYLRDNSEGLPVDIDEESKLSKLELILTQVVGKSKFKKGHYYITGGLHGFGLTVANMLSSLFVIEVARDGYLWQQTYKQGEAQSPLEPIRALEAEDSTGTAITFRPDFTIFEQYDFNYKTLAKRCSDLAYQIAGLRIILRDERSSTPQEEVFYTKHGLKSLVLALTEHSKLLHEPLWGRYEVSVPRENQSAFNLGVECAFVFTADSSTQEHGFVNTVETEEGGTHVSALRQAILNVINDYHLDSVDKLPIFLWQDVSPGLTSVISIRHPEPVFESPTKVRLRDPRIVDAITEVIFEEFRYFASHNPKAMRAIIKHCIANQRRSETNAR